MEENPEATQIMQLPNLAQVSKPLKTEDPEEDLDAMLAKLRSARSNRPTAWARPRASAAS